MDVIERTLQDRIVGNNPNLTSYKVKHIILHNPLRQYFIEVVKAPLLKAIIALSNKFPEPTESNTDDAIAHAILDIQDKFFSYESNAGRKELFEAAFKIFIAEIEHDDYYRFRLDWILEEMIKKILDGKWESLPLNAMRKFCWNEPEPYGGENSIIYKMMQHRNEIKRTLGID